MKLLLDHSILILLFLWTKSCILAYLCFYLDNLPVFTEPTLGFEARKNSLADRINSLKLLTSGSELSLNPYLRKENVSAWFAHSRAKRFSHFPPPSESTGTSNRKHYGIKSDEFCGEISDDHVHLILRTADDLFSAETIRLLCRMDIEYLRLGAIKDLLVNRIAELDATGKPCRSWSLPNYIAAINNKTSCASIQGSDIQTVRNLLALCWPHFRSAIQSIEYTRPTADTIYRFDDSVPIVCTTDTNYRYLYDLMYYILDTKTLDSLQRMANDSEKTSGVVSVFLPIAKSFQRLDYYERLERISLDSRITVAAMDLGIRDALFDRFLIKDLRYVILAFIFICISMYCYSQSLLVTLIVIGSILCSLIDSYWIYKHIYGLQFFPFMNILSFIIAIAIGSDNALIYCKNWDHFAANPLVGLRRSFLSTFLASLTTALALFSSYLIDVTSIKCFSLFTGTVVMVNFFTVFLSLPAALVLSGRCGSLFHKSVDSSSGGQVLSMASYAGQSLSTLVFDVLLARECIRKAKWPLAIVFTAFSIAGFVAIFIAPGFRLPEGERSQQFPVDHPFEVYEQLKTDFLFKSLVEREIVNQPVLGYFVFGVLPIDDGEVLNPRERGDLTLDDDFDITPAEVQLWISQLCRNFTESRHFRPSLAPLTRNCLMDTFRRWIEQRDCPHNDVTDRCCRDTGFPLPEELFSRCLVVFLGQLHTARSKIRFSDYAGFWINRKSFQIRALVIEYETNYTLHNYYKDAERVLNGLEDWFNDKLTEAPDVLRSGWALPEGLETYALQAAMISGTKIAILGAIGLAIVAILITTRNFKLASIALVTISGCIFSTIAALVLLGWKLDVTESIIIILAIGMSIDFTLHYAIAFETEMKVLSSMSWIQGLDTDIVLSYSPYYLLYSFEARKSIDNKMQKLNLTEALDIERRNVSDQLTASRLAVHKGIRISKK